MDCNVVTSQINGTFHDNDTKIDIEVFVDATSGYTPSFNYRYVDGNNTNNVGGLTLSPTTGAASGQQRWHGTISDIVTGSSDPLHPPVAHGLTFQCHANVSTLFSPMTDVDGQHSWIGTIISTTGAFASWGVTPGPVDW